jgi:tetratricopeptide (TPR) repeat protein
MNNQSPSAVIKEAKRLIGMNEFDRAKLLLQPLIAEYNEDYRIYALTGFIYHREGRFARAIRNYERSLELNPNDVETLINLSLIYNDLGRYEEGAGKYRLAVELMDKNKSSGENTGRKSNEEELNVMFASQHKSLGELYMRYNKPGDALHEYEKALKLIPWDYSLNIELAECLSRLGERKVAINKLKSVKQKNPELLDARIKLGHLLYLEGEIGLAMEEWDSILKQEPANATAKMYIRMAKEENIIP